VIVLAVLGLCFAFLYPTLKWYFWTNQEDKALALASREKIKDYSPTLMISYHPITAEMLFF